MVLGEGRIVRQPGGHRQGVDGPALGVEVGDDGEDALVGGAEEVLGAQDLEDARGVLGGREERREHRLLGEIVPGWW
jgi:hypothetical protein